jgi:hypothetical protein
MITGNGDAERWATRLVVITTNPTDTADVVAWLGPGLFPDDVAVVSGFFAGVAALNVGRRAVVVDMGIPDERDSWRLAELRHRGRDAAYVVVADATFLPQLAGALSTDLAVTSASRLPPLRELLVSKTPLADDQTIWRRTMR